MITWSSSCRDGSDGVGEAALLDRVELGLLDTLELGLLDTLELAGEVISCSLIEAFLMYS